MTGLDQKIELALVEFFDTPAGVRVRFALRGMDIVTVRDLLKLKERDILRCPGVGRICLSRLQDALAKLGLKLGVEPAMPPSDMWQPMFLAPRDGTRIIALQCDFSGVALIRWGEFLDQTGGGWFHSDWSIDEFTEWAGWIPVPDSTPDPWASGRIS